MEIPVKIIVDFVGVTISKQIEAMINSMPKGSVIFIDDFLNKFEYETAPKAQIGRASCRERV